MDVPEALEVGRAHPGHRTKRQFIGAALTFATIAVAAAMFSFAPVAIVLVAIAAYFAWMAWYLSRTLIPGAIENIAHDHVQRGDREGARRLLDACERMPLARYLRRWVELLRAHDALADGNTAAVEAYATRAIEGRTRLVSRGKEQMAIRRATALRALARAARHDGKGAAQDIADALASDHNYPVTLAHAHIAAAVAAANAENKTEVRDALSRAAPFLDDIDGQTRSLVHRVARYARDAKKSAYRHPAKPDNLEAEGWLGRGTVPTQVPAMTSPSQGAAAIRTQTFNKARAAHPRSSIATVLLWVLLVLMFLAIWQTLNPAPPKHAHVHHQAPTNDFLQLVGVLVGGFFLLSVPLRIMLHVLKQAQVRRDALSLLTGSKHAHTRLVRLAEAGSAEAALQLAEACERNAAFEEAIAWCDTGLGYTQRAGQLAATWDSTAPGLSAERAFCLAALRREDESNAELAAMPNARGFARRSRTHFRVKLAQALMRGDRDAALTLAHARGDSLIVPTRDAVLLELLEMAANTKTDADEAARLASELDATPSLARWVAHFAPDLVRGGKPHTADTADDALVEAPPTSSAPKAVS